MEAFRINCRDQKLSNQVKGALRGVKGSAVRIKRNWRRNKRNTRRKKEELWADNKTGRWAKRRKKNKEIKEIILRRI